MSSSEARRAAFVRFGGVESAKVLTRKEIRRTPPWHRLHSFPLVFDSLSLDARHAARSLMRAPGFAVSAALIFAVGIGLNVAAFSVFDRLMFRPLPYTEPERLVLIHRGTVDDPKLRAAMLPGEVAVVFRDESPSLDGLAWEFGWTDASVPVPGENPLQLAAVTFNALDVLGVRPVLGRSFEVADATAATGDAPRVVLLSHEAWRSRFGGDVTATAPSWHTNGRQYRVIGVLPEGFLLPSSRLVERLDGLIAIRPDTRPGLLIVAPFARLRTGVTRSTAAAELTAMFRQYPWSRQYLRDDAKAKVVSLRIEPLQSGMSVLVRPYLWGISAAVWLVLGIACLNLSTLLLARGQRRLGDLATRAAMGAAPWRLVRLGLLECALVCAAGAAIGVLTCFVTQATLLSMVPPRIRGVAVTPFDLRILLVTLGVTGLCALVAGIAPALSARRLDLLSFIRADEAYVARFTSLKTGFVLVLVSSALGVVLAGAAAVVVPPVVGFLLRPPGFEADDLFTIRVGHQLPADADLSQPVRADRVRTILDTVRQLPHVQGAAATLAVSFPSGSGVSEFWKQQGSEGDEFAVSAGFSEVLRTPVVAGRTFSEVDIRDRARVAVLSVAGARLLWPGESLDRVVGRRVQTAGGDRTVVGLVEGVRGHPGAAAVPQLYLPITASETRLAQARLPVMVRMASGAVPDHTLLTERMNAVFPPSTVRVEAMSAQLAPIVEGPRFLAALFALFAAVALLLASAGVYGVSAFETRRLRRELGLRIALGATPWDIRGYVMRLTMRPVICGAAIGAVGARAVAHVAQERLDSIGFASWVPYTVAVLLVVTAAVVAMWWPVRRALRADPATILRT